MSVGSCCRHLWKRYSEQHRAVICKKWILPLRLAAVASLVVHMIWRAFHPAAFYTTTVVFIHCAVALFLLAECRRSERYHRTVEEFERREALLKNDAG